MVGLRNTHYSARECIWLD